MAPAISMRCMSRPPSKFPSGLASLGRTTSAISDCDSFTVRGCRWWLPSVIEINFKFKISKQYCPGKTWSTDSNFLKLLTKVTVVGFFDFNSASRFCHYFAAFQLFSKAAHEYRTDCLFTTHG